MYKRTARISEEIKKTLAQLLSEVKDPRKPMLLSITAVKVTNDLSYADVYYSAYGTAEDKKNAAVVLESARGFFRHELGRRMRLRQVPVLRMKPDESIDYGFKMDKIIDEVIKQDEEAAAKKSDSED